MGTFLTVYYIKIVLGCQYDYLIFTALFSQKTPYARIVSFPLQFGSKYDKLKVRINNIQKRRHCYET